VLLVDDEIRSLVVKNASTDDIRAAARKAGMKTLAEDGMVKILEGVTSVEEVMGVAFV